MIIESWENIDEVQLLDLPLWSNSSRIRSVGLFSQAVDTPSSKTVGRRPQERPTQNMNGCALDSNRPAD